MFSDKNKNTSDLTRVKENSDRLDKADHSLRDSKGFVKEEHRSDYPDENIGLKRANDANIIKEDHHDEKHHILPKHVDTPDSAVGQLPV